MATKTVLKPEIKMRFLESETLIGMLADRLRVQSQGLRRKFGKENAPSLCLPHVEKEIKEILGLSPDEEITMIVEIEPAPVTD